MKKITIIALIVFAMSFMMFGCDQLKDLLGIGVPEPPATTTAPPGVGAQPHVPTGPGTGPPGFSSPYKYGPPNALNCCTITNFEAGIITFDDEGSYEVNVAGTIPYIPGTQIGLAFNYISNTGSPIQYLEEEFFPYPPQNWTLWESSVGSYRIFPDENRAEYTTLLTPSPDAQAFISYWGMNPSGDPLGEWIWDIYFDGEYYTTVVFNIVQPTY
jgi:hypothetical protein